MRPGLDRFAEADVVGDEQVYARQPQGLAERLELVGVDADAGAERRLEKWRIGRGDAVPAQRVQVGAEEPCLVESALADGAPRFLVQDARVELVFPNGVERLSLRVIVHTCEMHHGVAAAVAPWLDFLDEPRARSGTHHLSGLRSAGFGGVGCWEDCRFSVHELWITGRRSRGNAVFSTVIPYVSR